MKLSNPFKRKFYLEELLKHGVFVDVESAGLNAESEGILSVGAIDMLNESYYGECHLYAWQKPHPKALEINGFSKESTQDMDKDSAHEMIRRFINWCKERNLYYIIGKNSRWDYEMMKYPWDRVFLEGPKPEQFPLSHRVIDLTSLGALAYIQEGKEIPQKGINSAELQAYLGIPDEPKPHNALTGAKYNKEMLEKLIEKIL